MFNHHQHHSGEPGSARPNVADLIATVADDTFETFVTGNSPVVDFFARGAVCAASLPRPSTVPPSRTRTGCASPAATSTRTRAPRQLDTFLSHTAPGAA